MICVRFDRNASRLSPHEAFRDTRHLARRLHRPQTAPPCSAHHQCTMLRLTALVLLGLVTALATGEANDTECPFTLRIGEMMRGF